MWTIVIPCSLAFDNDFLTDRKHKRVKTFRNSGLGHDYHESSVESRIMGANAEGDEDEDEDETRKEGGDGGENIGTISKAFAQGDAEKGATFEAFAKARAQAGWCRPQVDPKLTSG
jgi:hypothetical protein